MLLYVILIILLYQQDAKPRGFAPDYLSKDSTDAVRGLFILLIFASHFIFYVDPYTATLDTLYLDVRTFLGQGVVTCFFFYSGYGIATAARSKGTEYVRSMPHRRILPTLLIYDCSQILFLILQLFLGQTYTGKDFISSMLAWTSFGNDNWYIFVILGLYLITWLVLRGRELDKVTAARISVGALAFLLFLWCADKGSWWFNTLLCYPLGMWFCIYKDQLDCFLSKASHYWPTALVLVAVFILTHHVWSRSMLFYILTMMLFPLCVVFLTMKLPSKNPILIYCGRHLQGLFLLHRLPFIALSNVFPHSGLWIYFYFALSVAITFLMDALFSRAMTFLRNSTPVKTQA